MPPLAAGPAVPQLHAEAAMQRSHWRAAAPAARFLGRQWLPVLPTHIPTATHGAGQHSSQPDSKSSSGSSQANDHQEPELQQPPLRRSLPYRRSSRLSRLSQPLRGKHFGRQLAPGTFFRFWHDEKRFKGTGETSLVQRALLAAGGMRTGGNVKAAPLSGPMGWQRVADWDVLWSPSSTALKAADFVKPGQLISTVPGLFAITKKKRMPASLHAAYGSDAWQIIPPTYSIPSQLQQWRSVLKEEALQQRDAALHRQQLQHRHKQQEAAKEDAERVAHAQPPVPQAPGSGVQTGMHFDSAEARSGGVASTSGRMEQQPETGLWILKTAQHLGKGLKVVSTRAALKELVERNKQFLRLPPGSKAALAARKVQESEDSSDSAKHKPERPYVAAQRYITNPLLIQGRKFGIRVWLLVLGPAPLRAYMHRKGLVLFSSEAYEPGAWAAEDGSVAPGHVTNYAQNVDGMVWPVGQLEQHLGQQQYQELWRRMERASALTVAAAVAGVKEEAARLGSPPESAFELLGLDFIVDTNLQPFLLEINATPSLAVEHSEEDISTMIHQQKSGMVLDMLSLLRLRQRFGSAPAAAESSACANVAADAGNHAHAAAHGTPMALETTQHHPTAATEADTDAYAEREHVRHLVTATVADSSAALHDALQQQPELLERLVDVECEARAANGWKPLLPLMPFEAAERGWQVPWGAEELALAEYWKLRQAQPQPTPQQQQQQQQHGVQCRKQTGVDGDGMQTHHQQQEPSGALVDNLLLEGQHAESTA